MLVISDTSPITNLLKIGRLNLLKDVFQEVIVPDKVNEELLKWKDLGGNISAYENASWVTVRGASNVILIRNLKLELDDGEAEAIALADELKADYLLIDERRGWNVARSMGINAVGIIGVLLQAKKQGIEQTIIPIVDDLRNVAGFWISDSFYTQIKAIVKE
jgi:uncharacterized protein